ncbi:TPA: hypothetical protein ACPVXQ_004417 [Vibrio parahaemolyticus]|uniref:Wzy n=2 Tax=Vibrio parahaemolyticus TaxID=670 RepID=A0A7M1WEP2_VIBPH|nr:hypothetical protein [Vibrio parahaemolyticus]EGR1119512.1 hypothetical protein [Vibrio parahaemolyticus]EQM11934.1 putative membrane protein [Vibrio parahaemolyticus 3259]ETJ91076.1 putative membrane protein [Vibrio parahaemolyticus EKP-008]QOS25523.1 hypothetical protein VP439_00014 [Vibrio parahaemolyticus]HCH2419142.1 hypothetical protein [Vibrio parahaemolyticus]
MKIIKQDSFLLGVLLFLFSICNLGPAPLALTIAFVSLFLFYDRFKFNFYNYLIILLFFLLCAWALLFSYHELYFKVYAATFIYVILAFLVVGIITGFSKDTVINAIVFVIFIHLATIIFQQFFYILTKHYIDLHQVVTLGKYLSRNESGFINGLGMTRPTGFYVEPSSVAAIITFFNVWYYILNKRATLKFYVIQFLTMLSFSFAAIAISLLIIAYTFFRHELIKKVNIKTLISLFVVALIFIYFVNIFYIRLTGGVGYDSVGFRQIILNHLINRDIMDNLFGEGILIFESAIKTNGLILSNSNIRDSGLWVNIIFSLGIFGLIAFTIFIAFFSGGLSNFIVLSFALFSKFDYLQPIVWFSIFLLLTHKRKFN